MSTSLAPPGIVHEGTLIPVHNGGDSTIWLPFEKVKLYTNAFIIQNGKVCTTIW